MEQRHPDNDPDAHVRGLAAGSLAGDDPTGWFDRLYAAAESGDAVVPWDRGEPQPLLVDWAGGSRGEGRSALVVGAGLGADAEYVAGLGFRTTAFDVSETAIRAARRRYPQSRVDYRTADLLDPPPEWRGAFDLVVESMTVQSLPVAYRERATASVAGFVAPGGSLLVVAARAGDPGSAQPGHAAPWGEGPPWPLTRADVDAFAAGGLRPVLVEAVPPSRVGSFDRWRAHFVRS